MRSTPLWRAWHPNPVPTARRRNPRLATALAVIGVLTMVASLGVGGYLIRTRTDAAGAGTGTSPTSAPAATPTGTLPPSPSPVPSPAPIPPTYPATGPDTYVFAPGESGVFGTAGTVRRYRVAVEKGITVAVDDFTSVADATLSDPRSWIAGGNVRLQRVPKSAPSYHFTIYLMTPGTAQRHCLAGGFDIFWRGEPYTSCRVGGKVIINVARYLKGVPKYGAPVEDYQRYAINHEVGHVLGHGHELCPGEGKPAPVMQQQTFSLQGCTAYFWPYRNGKRYAGPPGRIVPPG